MGMGALGWIKSHLMIMNSNIQEGVISECLWISAIGPSSKEDQHGVLVCLHAQHQCLESIHLSSDYQSLVWSAISNFRASNDLIVGAIT